MIKNYIKIALRSTNKNLLYTVINLTGLSIGLASFLLIGIWIINEVSYDKYYTHADRMYRASMEFGQNGVVFKTYVSPTKLLPTLQALPEVEKGVRIYHHGFNPLTVSAGEKSFKEVDLFYADSTFFEIFTLDIINGNPNVLYDPSNAAISERIALKYFGNDDPIGKIIEARGLSYKVDAVYKNMPPNSHFNADLILPFSSHPSSKVLQWGSANYSTYFLLSPGTSIAEVDKKVNEMLKEEVPFPMTSDNYMNINILPVTDIHLFSNADMEMGPKGNIGYIYIFSAIAFLVLIIACINYMNLASARATTRAREVGVRKVMGAFKKQLVLQFLGESLFMTVVATIIALVIVQLAMPVFSGLAGFSYNIMDVLSLEFISGLILIVALVAFLAGSYPAFVLSSFNPHLVLKGTFTSSSRGIGLRKFLVVFQYVITIVLITGTFIIYDQLQYMQNKALGYDKDHIIELGYNKEISNSYTALKNALKQHPGVVEVTRGSDSPVSTRGGYTIKSAGLGDDNNSMVTGLAVDESYIDVMGIQMALGRKFSENDWTQLEVDQYAFVINKQTQESLLLGDEEVIGYKVEVNGRKGEIMGVTEDFHFSGLQNKIGPIVMFLEPQFNKVFIKLEKGIEDLPTSLTSLHKVWASIVPGSSFEYSFLDEHYASLYQAEARLGRLFFVFSTLAIFIACLGLFGLVSYMALQKIKEIGIRKILGATVINLIFTLSKQFAILIVVAFLLSIPLAWYIMDVWLNNFAYKINISFYPFLWAAGIALLIGSVTVGLQSYKAATANPVNSLRGE